MQPDTGASSLLAVGVLPLMPDHAMFWQAPGCRPNYAFVVATLCYCCLDTRATIDTQAQTCSTVLLEKQEGSLSLPPALANLNRLRHVLQGRPCHAGGQYDTLVKAAWLPAAGLAPAAAGITTAAPDGLPGQVQESPHWHLASPRWDVNPFK